MHKAFAWSSWRVRGPRPCSGGCGRAIGHFPRSEVPRVAFTPFLRQCSGHALSGCRGDIRATAGTWQALWVETARPRPGAAPTLTSPRGARPVVSPPGFCPFTSRVQPRSARRTRPGPSRPPDSRASSSAVQAGQPTDRGAGRAVTGVHCSAAGGGLCLPAGRAARLGVGFVPRRTAGSMKPHR